MANSFEIIEENLRHAEFKAETGETFSVDKPLNEIATEMNKQKWFFTDSDRDLINNLKRVIADYKNDMKKVIRDNKRSREIKLKGISTKLNKNIRLKEKEDADYLASQLRKEYTVSLLKKEKVRQNLRKIKMDFMSKCNAKYNELVKGLVKENSVDTDVKNKIELIMPILDLQVKDLNDVVSSFSKNKNKDLLLKRLLKKQTHHYFVPIYNVNDKSASIKLSNFVEILDIAEFRKKYNKYNFYDTFIDSMRQNLYQNTKLVHFRISCVGLNKSLMLLSNYYEAFIDIVCFFESDLSFRIDSSGNRFYYFRIQNKHILGGFHQGNAIISELELSDTTKKDFKVFDFLFKENVSKVSLKVKNSLKYLRKAKCSIFNEDKLLYYVIALEALVLDSDDWGNPGKEDMIIKRITGFITYYPEYSKLPEKIKDCYRMRHLIVHKGEHSVNVTKDDFSYLERTAYALINYLIYKRNCKTANSALHLIIEEKNKYYQQEKDRLSTLGIQFNKEYQFTGKIRQNNVYLCDVKGVLSFNDSPKDFFIDPVITKTEPTTMIHSFIETNADKFYLDCIFDKYRISSELNIPLFTIQQILFPNEPSFFIQMDDRIFIRLKSMNEITEIKQDTVTT